MTIANPYYGDEALDGPQEPEYVYINRLPNAFGDAENIILLRWAEMTVAEKAEWQTIGTLSLAERWDWANEVQGMMFVRAGH